MVVALIALFVAMGGAGYAAFKLPKNSVGSKQLKDGAVTAKKVRAGSLLAGDFRAGQLPAGPQGIQGPKGDPGQDGQPGPAARWAIVEANGTITAQSGGISLANYQGGGDYFLGFGSSQVGKSIIVTERWTGGGTGWAQAVTCSATAGTPPATAPCMATGTGNTNTVLVETKDYAGATVPEAFYIVIPQA
jgi:hypothetical protein